MQKLRRYIDRWFEGVRQGYRGQMQCRKGCAFCCYGLFDVSLADAVEVLEGLDRLPDDTRQAVGRKAERLQDAIFKIAPNLEPPYVFNRDDPCIDRIVDEIGNPACPFLGESNECLIYQHRPLACRLEGVPQVDIRDGLFGDWCELNFTDGLPPEAAAELALDYADVERIDAIASRQVAERLGITDPEVTIFLPSLICESRRFGVLP